MERHIRSEPEQTFVFSKCYLVIICSDEISQVPHLHTCQPEIYLIYKSYEETCFYQHFQYDFFLLQLCSLIFKTGCYDVQILVRETKIFICNSCDRDQGILSAKIFIERTESFQFNFFWEFN